MRIQKVARSTAADSPPRRIARLALTRADGASIERRIQLIPPEQLEQHHLRALRSACQSLQRELADSPLAATRWAAQLLRATDEALELLGCEAMA